ncbi:MAG: hypothetical protein ACK5ES_09745, partial [Planctomyces sp.]
TYQASAFAETTAGGSQTCSSLAAAKGFSVSVRDMVLSLCQPLIERLSLTADLRTAVFFSD